MVGLPLQSILAGWVKEIEKERKRIEIEIGRLWGPHDWWPTKIMVMEGCRWSINNKKEEDRMEERMNGERKREREKRETMKWVGWESQPMLTSSGVRKKENEMVKWVRKGCLTLTGRLRKRVCEMVS